jgi:beta-lactam-binding protein with PASTA domain
VPDVRGQPLSVAVAALQEAGFIARELRTRHAEPRDTVYDQSPAPGIQQAPGSAVTIAVSDGPD